MRLRHKKNAEELILKENYCINNYFNYNKENFSTNTKSETLYYSENVFKNNNKTYLELGIGKGKFIIENALNNPNINFIGIEKSATILLKTILNLNNKLKEQSIEYIDNLKFLCIDINAIENYFNENSIDKLYLNFSDPWPKDRHYKRRLTYRDFLYKYYKILRSGGILEFKTDQKKLFNFTLEEIKETKFSLVSYTYDLHNDIKLNINNEIANQEKNSTENFNNMNIGNSNNIMTEYEEKFSRLGNKICKLILKK